MRAIFGSKSNILLRGLSSLLVSGGPRNLVHALMSLSLPLTNTIHWNVFERLNIKMNLNFDFASDAYRPNDKQLSKRRNRVGMVKK